MRTAFASLLRHSQLVYARWLLVWCQRGDPRIINNGTNVPGWKSGDFVDNEMWTGFHDIPNSWVEVGSEVGGSRGSATKPEAFYAFQTSAKGSLNPIGQPASNPRW